MDISNARTSTITEVQKAVAETRRALFEHGMRVQQGKDTDRAEGRRLRRRVAQLLTVIREKELLDHAKETITG